MNSNDFADEIFSAVCGSVRDDHKMGLSDHLKTFVHQLCLASTAKAQREINAAKKLCKEFFIAYAVTRYDCLYCYTFKCNKSAITQYAKKAEKVEFVAEELLNILAGFVAEDRFVWISVAAREAIDDALSHLKVVHRGDLRYFSFETKSGVKI